MYARKGYDHACRNKDVRNKDVRNSVYRSRNTTVHRHFQGHYFEEEIVEEKLTMEMKRLPKVLIGEESFLVGAPTATEGSSGVLSAGCSTRCV